MEMDNKISQTLNSSSIENDFKIAQVLQRQEKFNQAIEKYKQVISTIENIIRQNPNSSMEYNLVPLSIAKLVEIYKDKEELDKALKLLDIQKKFLEKIAISKPNHPNDQNDSTKSSAYSASSKKSTLSDDSDSDSNYSNEKEIDIISLFDQLDEALKIPPPKAKENPEDILNTFLKEKEKQNNAMAKENMMRLLQLVEEKKWRLENSRTERWMDWMNNNPVAILIFAIVFLGLFLIFIVVQFQINDKDIYNPKHNSHQNADFLKNENIHSSSANTNQNQNQNNNNNNGNNHNEDNEKKDSNVNLGMNADFDPSKHMPGRRSNNRMSKDDFEKLRNQMQKMKDEQIQKVKQAANLEHRFPKGQFSANKNNDNKNNEQKFEQRQNKQEEL